MPRPIRLVLFTIIGLLFLLYLYYSEYDVLPNIIRQPHLYLYTVLTSLLSGIVINLINRKLDEKLPWRRNIMFRFVAGLFSDFLALAVILIVVSWLAEVLGFIEFKMFSSSISESQLEVKLIVLGFLTLFIVTLVEFNSYSFNEFSVGQIRKSRAERKQLEFQFEALKSQLSPHYLFNSMNTISSLIYRDPQIAENFIRNLAETFNYVLNTKDVKLVTLSQEIEALKDFNYLLSIRYAKALEIKIELNEAIMNTNIPPLSLQLLVENAVKHNVVSDEEPLKINIRNDENSIIILNNKTAAPSKSSSHKVGLDNIQKRYAFFTSINVEVNDEDYFEVKLPILKAK
jgi:LytS/YehU family sensor histidine kinase